MEEPAIILKKTEAHKTCGGQNADFFLNKNICSLVKGWYQFQYMKI